LSLNPVMTVGQQIAEVLALHQGLRENAAQQRGVDLLDQVGIPDAARRMMEYPFQLSGGMKTARDDSDGDGRAAKIIDCR